MESITISRFKTFLEQCFDKKPFPFCSLLHVKNCVLYIDISVEFAFDSCVEISKFLNKSGNTTENDRNQPIRTLHPNKITGNNV